MKFKIVGKTNPIHRVVTGLNSFDKAFINKAGKIGLPMRGIVELAGPTGCGKTTLVLGLAGLIASIENSSLSFSDIEGYDSSMLETVLDASGFSNTLYLINETTDAKALDGLLELLSNDKLNNSVGIFDSIGAISPISEIDGEIGEANMGQRAKLVAQFSRKLNHLVKDAPKKVVFMINHQYPQVGGRGLTTPGGVVIDYIAPIRIRIQRVPKEEYSDGSYALQGKIIKNRYGLEDNMFYVFVVAGYGISPEMTTLFECKKNKLLNGDWRGIKYNGQSFGNYDFILKKALDKETEFFQPFYDALKTINNSTNTEVPDDVTELEDDTTTNNSEE